LTRSSRRRPAAGGYARRVRRQRIDWTSALAAVLAFGMGAAAAEPEAAASAEAPPATEQPAELDRLLTLPGGQSYGVDRRGGLSRGEWRSRFSEVQDALVLERKGLEEAEGRLDEVAGSSSNWQMAPLPGMQPSPDAPLDYQLRFAIRRHKSEIERLERKLKELEIEANLAGVPAEWRS
jgi:hypothetical protein